MTRFTQDECIRIRELAALTYWVHEIDREIHRKAVAMTGEEGDDEKRKVMLAAPLMLAACRDVLTYLEHPEGQSPNGFRLTTAMNVLRDVIHQATYKE